ncbi:MAG: hypothetical protein HQM04_15175 [Magnetococcales bacterium]|nr:hypothetical protein [Magnetococcales bacterium]MBF0116368.1 hypothetical protein [Magnetococcales bacterium]
MHEAASTLPLRSATFWPDHPEHSEGMSAAPSFQEILEQHAWQKGNHICTTVSQEGEGITSLEEFSNVSVAEMETLLQEVLQSTPGQSRAGFAARRWMAPGGLAQQWFAPVGTPESVASEPRSNALLRRYAQWQQAAIAY